MKQYVLSVYISNALYRRISMAQTLISWSEFLDTMFSLFKEANSILISQIKNYPFKLLIFLSMTWVLLSPGVSLHLTLENSKYPLCIQAVNVKVGK